MLPAARDKNTPRLNMALLPPVDQCYHPRIGTGRIDRIPGFSGCWGDFAPRCSAATTRIDRNPSAQEVVEAVGMADVLSHRVRS